MRGIFSLGQSREEKKISKILFLIGLFSSTQINIGGYTAITEFVLVLLLPVMFLKNMPIISKDRCGTIVLLLFIWIAGVIFTDIRTDTPFPFMVRGLLPPIGILASFITIYPLLKKSPSSFKWFILAGAISSIISIFIFQHGSDVGRADVMNGDISAVEAVVGYKLFWVGKITQWISMPIYGWYLNTPSFYTISASIFLSAFALASGGRSAFLGSAISAFIVIVAGKTFSGMQKIKRLGPIIILALIVIMPLIKMVYAVAAKNGWMGEEELLKYEKQADGRSTLDMMMASRAEFFIALDAIKDHPFFGHGSHAMDTHGYVMNFVAQHGTSDELKLHMEVEKLMGIRTIPAHSHIAEFWLWAGIPGALPWFYILYLIIGTLFKRMHVIPEYFGYFAMTLPSLIWHIFFSPFAGRIGMGFMIAMFLLVRNVDIARHRNSVISYKAW